jgi:hypothetical protein
VRRVRATGKEKEQWEKLGYPMPEIVFFRFAQTSSPKTSDCPTSSSTKFHPFIQ